MSATPNYFSQLNAIDVRAHIEKKGQFSYLSWPYAVAQLRQFDETASWQIVRFNGLPFLTTDHGTFVEVAVTVKNVTLSQLHPVLDSRNHPILTPNAFDINTSIQRCLVKAIALHGLGLNVYAGEDLPPQEQETNSSSPSSRSSHFPAASRNSKGEHQELLTANQLRYIRKLIDETGTDVEQLLAFFDLDALEHTPKSVVNRVIRVLESHRLQEAA